MVGSNLLGRSLSSTQWNSLKQILASVSSTLLGKLQTRGLSNNTALICKVRRESFLRTYPALVIQPDGSSFYIRYHEPRSIIQLPVDTSTLSPEELKIRIAKRQPKRKVEVIQEEKDNYQASKYIKLVKKKK